MRNWTRGKTQKNVINDKKDWETEQGEEHKIKSSMIRNTEKTDQGEEHKIMWSVIRKN